LQGNLCAEMQMNKLAEALGMDPVELRARNLITQDGKLPNGSPLPNGAQGALLTLQKTAEESGWKHTASGWQSPQVAQSQGRRARGLGFAAGWKNDGLGGGTPDSSEAVIELIGDRQIEKARMHFAGADVGQGTQSAMLQVAADALGLRIEQIELIGADTAFSPSAGTASGSRMTMMAGNAILLAAAEALRGWHNEERPAIGRGHYEAPITTPPDKLTPGTQTHYSLGYTAGCAEVEVDLDTGAVRLLSFTSTLDAGKAVNPQQVEGQAHGGLAQAIGWALTEKFVQEDGLVKTPDFTTYLLPTVLDVPQNMRIFLVETPDEHGPFGARGIGELPMLTAAPAILAAIHNATGVWVNHVPARAEDVWQELETTDKHR
jgi:CO/xanthine dehydrogenase Mo-binding subunit